MADNNTTIGVNVVTKGLNEAVDASSAVAKNLKNAAEASKGIRVPLPTQAARAGVANAQGQQSSDSNTARGISGATGASARDFAAQAQGLGGLVHVYATFAANLFAIGAAFSALSKAADTSNLVKGLDQIGAASGRGLGTLAKQLSEVTDGAINLRDAMTATALASAGGLTSQAILRMGNVARNASQALGVSMPDAINRISKGIVKLQPELLDELGIMTRVDTATSDYAKSVGKSVLALSNFEKRQAFANAVLKEGEEKFGAISLAANPYQKILASVENLTQSSLELVNKGLGPLINALASSPTALAVTLAGIGTLLLKQAIPALGQYRNNLKVAVEESRDKLAKLYKDQQAISEQASIDASARATIAFRNAADTQRKIAELSDPNISFSKGTKIDYTALARKNALDITREELKQLDSRANYLAGRTSDIQKQESIVLKAHLADIKALKQASDNAGSQAEASKDAAETGKFSHATQLQRAYTKATQEATRDRILASVAETAATEGPVKAFRKLRDELQNQDTGNKFSKTMAGIKGSLSIATSAVNTFINAFSGWMQVIGLAVIGLQLFDSWASKNSAQAEATASALKALSEAGDSVDRTLDNISKKNPLGSISTESINAKATAVNELAGALDNAFTKINEQVTNANWYDKLVDQIKADFGGGLLKNSAEEFAKGITKALSASAVGKDKTKAVEKLSTILGVDPTDYSKIKEVLADSPEKFMKLAPAIKEALKELGTGLSIIASKTKQVDDAFLAANKTMESILVSAVPTDPIAKLGMETMTVGKEMADAFKDPISMLSQFSALVGNTSRLRFLGGSLSKELLLDSVKIKENISEYTALNNALEKVTATEAEYIQKVEEAKRNNPGATDFAIQQDSGVSSDQIKGIKEVKNNILTAIEAYKGTINAYAQKASQAQDQVFLKGANLIEGSIAQGFAKATLSIAKAYSSLLAGGPGAIAEQERIAKAEIDLQLSNLNITKELINSNEALRQASEQLAIETAKSNLSKIIPKDATESKDLENKIKALEQRQRVLDISQSKVFEGSSGKPNFNSALAGKGSIEVTKAEDLKLAAQATSGVYYAKLAVNANIAAIAAGKEAASIEAMSKYITLSYTAEKDRLAVKASNLIVSSAELDIQTRLLAYMDNSTISAKQRLVEEQALVKQTQDRLLLEEQVSKLQYVLATAKDSNTKVAAEKDLGLVRQRLADFDIKAANDKRVRDLGYFKERQDNTKKELDTRLSIAKVLKDSEVATQNTLLTIEEHKLEIAKLTGSKKEHQIIADQATLDIAKEEAKTSQIIRQLEEDILKAKQAKSQIIEASPIKDLSGQNTAVQDAAIKSSNAAIENEKILLASTKEKLKVAAEYNALLSKQADIMSQIATITDGLTVAFGSVGTAIGNSVKAVQTYLNKQEIIDKKVKDNAGNTKVLNELELESIQNKADGAQAYLGASKAAFKQDSSQYKALAAAEKAAALISTGAAIAKLVSQSGWFGFAGAAALVALMASYGITGGSSGMPSGGFDAASQQKVQGTGQSFDASGNIVNSKGGVLGDSTAKAKSVDDSIAQIEKHSFKTLEYNNKMLDALKSIKTNTDGLTDALTRAGFTASNLNADGTVQVGKSTTAFSGSSFDPATLAIGKTNLPGSGALAKISSSIFGGGTNTTIEDTGILINGLISNIAKDANGLAQSYTNIKTVTSGGWFKSDKTNLSQDIKTLDNTVNTALEGAFTGIIDTVKASSDTLGKDPTVTGALIDSFTVALRVSAQGLKPEELAAALNAQISVAFNQLAETVFPELTRFQKAGEEMGTTVVRLARDVQVTSLALEAAGLNFNTSADLVSKVDVTESLIALAGGLDQFTTQTDYFKQNFLTAAEQLAPVQKRVTAEMTRLGFASVNTREGFANLVKGLDLTDPAQQATYASLLNVAEGFATVYPVIEDTTTSLADLVKQGKTLQDQLNKLTMSQADYRLTQIKGMDALQVAQYDANVALQLQIDLIGKKNSYTALDIDLLNAQGKTTEATALARKRELDAMDPALRAIQEQTNARKDEIAAATQYTSLSATQAAQDIDLLNAQGKAQDALTLTRERELALITDPTNKALQQLINTRKDEIAVATQYTSLNATYAAQDIELLNAQGNAQSALTLTRERELALITDPANKALQQSINIRKDEIASITQATGLKSTLAGLDVDLLNAQGRAADATALSRQRELDALLPENRAIQELINARKDEIAVATEATTLRGKISDEEINVLNAQGRSAEALTLTRIKEISALDPTNRGLQQQIYIMQDLAKAITDANQNLADIESEFNTLKDAAKTAADNLDSAIQTITDSFNTAADNLKTANANLAAAKKNIAQGWTTAKDAAVSAYVVVSQGLVAAQTALDGANSALADASLKAGDELRGLAKNIREFLKSLQTTDLGANNPAQQLTALKSQFASDVSAAQGGDKDALGRVTNTAQSLLTLAKTQSRTSLEYARTVGSVSSTLDALASSTEGAAANAKGDPADVVKAVDQVTKWQKALYDLQVRVNAKYGAAGLAIAKDAADTAASQNDPVVAALDSANAALDNLGKYDVAMAKSGASTDSLTSDLLDEFNAATVAQIAAQGELDLWQNVVAKAGINTALYTGSIEKTTAKAYDAFVKAKADNDVAQLKLERASKLLGEALISGFSLLADPLTTLNQLLTSYITNKATVANTPSVPKTAAIDSSGFITGTNGASGTVAQAKSWFDNAVASGMSDSDLYAAVTGQGLSSGMVDTILGLSSGTALKWATDRGFPAFAKGGIHAGGLALVGEQGPEIVNMGPAQVFSNKASNQLFNNDELVAELKALREEVAALRYTSEQSTIYNKKIRDTLVRVSRDGESLQTSVAA